MSNASHKADFTILAMLALLTVAAIAFIAWLAGTQESESATPWIRTTYSTNIEGAIACYTLFERLGVKVRRLESPLLPGRAQDVDVLFLIDPLAALSEGEQNALEDWVREGGVLITTPGDWVPGWPVERGEEDRTLPPLRRHERGGLILAIPYSAKADPLARDVSAVYLVTGDTLDLGQWESNPSFGPARQGDAEASPAEELLQDRAGTRIAARRLGAGRIVLLADSSFLANGWIGKADDAILAANLCAWALAQGRGRTVAFDEYHLGYGSHETGWAVMTGLLFTTPPGWAVLTLILAGLLYLLWRGRRFGVRRAPGRARRRSKLEFVTSVGETWRVAGARRLALIPIVRWFRRRCAATVGLPPSASSALVAGRLARLHGLSPDRWIGVLDACDDAISSRRLSAHRFAGLLQQMSEMEEIIFSGEKHGHPKSK